MELALVLATLARALAYSTPLLWAALGEIVAERSGVVNLGVEGMMILGALSGFVVAQTSGDPWLGLLAAAVAEVARHARAVTSPHTGVRIMNLGGAGNRVAPDATAYPHRNTRFASNIAAQWEDPSDGERHRAWTRAFWNAMRPDGTGGTYGNFLDVAPATDRFRGGRAARVAPAPRLAAQCGRATGIRTSVRISSGGTSGGLR